MGDDIMGRGQAASNLKKRCLKVGDALLDCGAVNIDQEQESHVYATERSASLFELQMTVMAG